MLSRANGDVKWVGPAPARRQLEAPPIRGFLGPRARNANTVATGEEASDNTSLAPRSGQTSSSSVRTSMPLSTLRATRQERAWNPCPLDLLAPVL